MRIKIGVAPSNGAILLQYDSGLFAVLVCAHYFRKRNVPVFPFGEAYFEFEGHLYVDESTTNQQSDKKKMRDGSRKQRPLAGPHCRAVHVVEIFLSVPDHDADVLTGPTLKFSPFSTEWMGAFCNFVEGEDGAAAAAAAGAAAAGAPLFFFFDKIGIAIDSTERRVRPRTRSTIRRNLVGSRVHRIKLNWIESGWRPPRRRR
jgi:hypothetical protein